MPTSIFVWLVCSLLWESWQWKAQLCHQERTTINSLTTDSRNFNCMKLTSHLSWTKPESEGCNAGGVWELGKMIIPINHYCILKLPFARKMLHQYHRKFLWMICHLACIWPWLHNGAYERKIPKWFASIASINPRLRPLLKEFPPWRSG